MIVMLKDLVRYAKETPTESGVLADDPYVQQKLAEMATDVAVSRLLTLRIVDMESRGMIPTYEVSVAFVFGMEVAKRFAKKAGEILGLYGQLAKGARWTPLGGTIQTMWLETIAAGVGGGSAEIQRSIIAVLGLGLPRAI
jgi:alkylation response protein AidB-like acyl-CoA dehydrogenase